MLVLFFQEADHWLDAGEIGKSADALVRAAITVEDVSLSDSTEYAMKVCHY